VVGPLNAQLNIECTPQLLNTRLQGQSQVERFGWAFCPADKVNAGGKRTYEKAGISTAMWARWKQCVPNAATDGALSLRGIREQRRPRVTYGLG